MQIRVIRGPALYLSVLVCLGLLTAWNLSRPRLETISRRDLAKLLPQQVATPLPRDTQSILRMDRMLLAAKQLRGAYRGLLARSVLGVTRPVPLASSTWSEIRPRVHEIVAMANSGPIEVRGVSDHSVYIVPLTPLRNVVHSLFVLAVSYGLEGDFAQADLLLSDGQSVLRALQQTHGDFGHYQVIVEMIQERNLVIQKLYASGACPSVVKWRWLGLLEDVGRSDDILARSIEAVFRDYAVPRMANARIAMHDIIKHGLGLTDFDSPFEPNPDEYENLGTYDAVRTARLAFEAYQCELDNTKRSFRSMDYRAERIAIDCASMLPTERGRRATFERARFRWAMNSTPNSIGRALISRLLYGNLRLCLIETYRWRAIQQATRCAMALKLFAGGHHGRYPTSLRELVPHYLATEPLDPYDGKPMRFNARKLAVYSVGRDLVDNGGDLSGRNSQRRDIGLTLGIQPQF